ncbi:uncharacterized protein LOC129218363 [Uloborus diversus]|uniref:uncharacterized protein LOC129218363 n=1 Tax=Uloborus diversus TaxID=327109 RepID=UPI00240A99CC|nr:uncharacterized protein LOC129218363 [Uloborus diversus]
MPKVSARSPSLTSQESCSAVIIADLVADVPIVDDSHIINRRPSGPKDKKDAKHGYNGPAEETFSPAVVNVGSMETVNMQSARNGGGISKGVILNATQFGPAETRLKLDSEKKEKDIALSPVSPMQVSQVPESTKEDIMSGFSEMSLSRKIAFGASFLPSILFVLCFAVILPCQKPVPCIEEKFRLILNDTDVSRLRIPNNIVFTYKNNLENGAMSIDENGEELWKTQMKESANFIECGNFASPDRKDCLVMDKSGVLYLFNELDGKLIWTRSITAGHEAVPHPAFFPDCDGKDVPEIALAVSKDKVRILSQINKVYDVYIPRCDTNPSRLTSWGNDTADLIFICQKGEKEVLNVAKDLCSRNVRVPQILSREIGDLSKGKILPTKDGLAVWIQDEVTFYDFNYNPVWTVSTEPHSNKNRFLLYGKFHTVGRQLALFSSDLNSRFLATRLDIENGNTTWTKSIKNTEASDVSHVEGKQKDFAVVVMKKVKNQDDITTEAVARINSVSTTIVSFIANEEINFHVLNGTGDSLVEEISIMELDGKEDGLIIDKKEILAPNGPMHESTILVNVQESDKRPLTIFVVQKSKDNQVKKSSIRSIRIANWDSSTEEFDCITK